MRHTSRLLLAGAWLGLAMVAPVAARAEITIRQAEYTAGVLVVVGETSRPRQRVTLDGRYTERSGRGGQFRFRVRYLPRDCRIEVKAGRDVRAAAVKNCEPAASAPGGGAGSAPDTPAATAGPAAGNAGPIEGTARLRVVRQSCEPGGLCMVVCRDGEFALNAVCSTGRARLRGERAVLCGSTTSRRIVAYCMSIGDDPAAEGR